MGSTIGIPCKFEVLMETVKNKNINDDQYEDEESENDVDDEALTNLYIDIYLRQKESDISINFILVQFQVEIQAKRSCPITIPYYFREEMFGTIQPNKTDFGFTNVVPQKGDIGNMALTEDGSLLIYVTVKMFNRNATPDLMLSAYLTKFENIFQQKLCSNLEKMYTSHQTNHQIVKLICKDENELLVNRDIVVARSSALKLLCTKHLNAGVLKMESVSFDVLNILVQFLYTGTLKETWKQEEIIGELLWAAHKYKLVDLMTFLTQVVALVCTVSNCGKLVSLARQLGLKETEKQLLNFFRRNASDLEQINRFVTDANFKLPEVWSSGIPAKETLVLREILFDKVFWARRKISCEIPNFPKILEKGNGFTHDISAFEIGHSIGVATRWKFFIRVHNIAGKDWIGMYLKNDVPIALLNNAILPIYFAVEITGNKLYACCRQELSENLESSHSKFGFDKVISVCDVKDELSNTGSLKVNFTVIIFNEYSTTMPDLQAISRYKNFESKFRQSLQFDLQKVYANLNKSLSLNDKSELTKIVASDGKEFLVNRTILCARSDVFQTMFQQKDMLEVTNGVVQIDDISSQSLNVLLHFLHCGKLLDSWKNPEIVEELAYAAQKYLVDDLREFLNQMLVQACTTQNCGKLLSLAKRLDMKVAEKQLMEYFQRYCSNSFEQVVLLSKQASAYLTPESPPTKRARITES